MKLLVKFFTKNSVNVLFYVSLFIFVHVYVLNYTLTFRKVYTALTTVHPLLHLVQPPENGKKYILSWHKYYLIFNKSRSIFPDLNCAVNNCEFSYQRNLLNGDYIYYDAILFNEYHLDHYKDLPRRRSQNQLYIYTSFESSFKHPACKPHTDGFYNWTFTYRFDSTLLWNYFVVRNSSGSVIAPSVTPYWQTNTDRIKPEIKAVLRGKKLAAAWLVSHCTAESKRDEYLKVLHEHLLSFSLAVDAYGICSGRECPNDDCDEMLKNDYYFYMAFENSLSKDYVTEKVLHGYRNYAVPIVYGGANYTRFLPPGSYINAREMHPYRLAVTIRDAIRYPQRLEKFFKWTNLYNITDDPKIYHPLCDLCEALNKEIKPAPAIKNFRAWWNEKYGISRCFPEPFRNKVEVNVVARSVWTVIMFVSIFSSKMNKYFLVN